MLKLKNIIKKYTTGEYTQIALNDVSINFRQNEFVAILGPSGSGKTTLLNITGGLLQYDEGDLFINGHSTKNFSNSDWDAYRNNSVGFIFQSYNLIPHLSVLDNVMMGMTLSGVSKQERIQRGMKVLEQVGLKEHISKKPNQLSGGQMQRVAIARSLVNDPDIILADEPTGALDTKTSKQIMALISEIAKDKLVIMVTHNPELAKEHATRIIEFQDGQIMKDSHPFDEASAEPDTTFEIKKTNMSFWNALKLSGKNISTKKWRTSLIAFASSIGIIGIALVLFISNGFNKQIESIESDTLSGYPIMIQKTVKEEAIGPQRVKNQLKEQEKNEKKRNSSFLYEEKKAENNTHTNDFSSEFLDYYNKIDKKLIVGTNYNFGINFNLIKKEESTLKQLSSETLNWSSYPEGINGDQSFLKNNYDLVAGQYPTKSQDLVLIVGTNNQLSETTIEALDLAMNDGKLALDKVIGTELFSLSNNEYYEKNENFYRSTIQDKKPEEINGKKLTISCVLRAKENIEISGLTEGVKHSNQLTREFLEEAKESTIVKEQKDTDINLTTGEPFQLKEAPEPTGRFEQRFGTGVPSVSSQTKEQVLMRLGGTEQPNNMTIYPTSFENKEGILEYLTSFNKDKKDEEQIIYTDLAATVTSLMGDLLDGITIVLVAFAAISLIVSLIMIGIITYISVMERTKEIGILRALGARKKDITRVFNAETFIIGICSGVLGIAISYALTFPINTVLENMTNMANIAQFDPVQAAILVLLSVSLTILGGMIPARIAAQKDPVEALSTE